MKIEHIDGALAVALDNATVAYGAALDAAEVAIRLAHASASDAMMKAVDDAVRAHGDDYGAALVGLLRACWHTKPETPADAALLHGLERAVCRLVESNQARARSHAQVLA